MTKKIVSPCAWFLLLIGTVALFGLSNDVLAAKRPNIVLIMADDK